MTMTAAPIALDLNSDLDTEVVDAFRKDLSIGVLRENLVKIAEEHYKTYSEVVDLIHGRFVWALNEGTLTPDEVNAASLELRSFFRVKTSA